MMDRNETCYSGRMKCYYKSSKSMLQGLTGTQEVISYADFGFILDF